LGWSVQQGIAKGRPAPDWYRKQPHVPDEALVFLRAFDHIKSDRAVTVTPLPNGRVLTSVGEIQWSTVERYGHSIGLDAENRKLLHDVIRVLDAEYIPTRHEDLKKSIGT
jgi:hypothetical protein